MDPNTNNLQQQIDELKRWKEAKERQQITFPLDSISLSILNQYFMRITDTYQIVGSMGNLNTTYVGIQGDKNFELAQLLLYPYTVNTTTDVFTISTGRFDNDRLVYLETENTYPDPLVALTTYYTINVTNGGTSFQLSLTSGGAAINITNVGVGRQFIGYVF